MDLQLQQKLALKQILTPQLVQTMELMQLPILELSQKLKQELVENPLLELKRESEESLLKENRAKEEKIDSDLADYRKLMDGLNQMDTQLYDPPDDEEDWTPFDRITYQTTLYDILTNQIRLQKIPAKITTLAEFIIGNLDERGFLPVSLDELLTAVIEQELVPEPSIDEMNEALEWVQKLEPTGIGARSVQECYLLQLEAAPDFDALAYEIVRDHFDMLGKKNLSEMERILKEPAERIKEALYKIYMLSSNPASDSADIADASIEPDLIVRKSGDKWQVVYNSYDVPPLSISGYYMKLLRKSNELSGDLKDFLKQKLDSAKWWIDALNMRRENMIRTMEMIIQYQPEFFELGPEFIKPMKMEDIAQEVNLHPATISRISKGKYVQTPHGVFPMKYFFTRGLTTDSGEDMSTRVIRTKLSEYIEKENKKKPLSDQNLADILTSDGINIARRTVAKYREELGIPTARLRKS